MKTKTTKLLVIGGGPGGYVAAIRAAQLGVATTLIESEALGGTCLNVGCIPSKALIHAADEFETVARAAQGASALGIRASAPAIEIPTLQKWKQGIVAKLTGGVGALLKKNGVEVVHGQAQIVDGKTVEVAPAGHELMRWRCEHLLLATGSETVALPGLPFGGPVVSSTEALALAEVPRHLVVVGAGYIGLELGIAWRKLGAEVAVVELAERVLPAYEEELGKPVAATLKRLGITVHTGCTAEGLTGTGGLRVHSGHGDGFVLPADKVLVAVGRRPRTAGFNLESLQLEMNGRAIKIDARCRTSMRDVWAIGDVTGEPMLAHRAMAQGEVVAECVAGHQREFAPQAIPAVCFTDPEVLVVGQTRSDATEAGLAHVSAMFPFAANGRALSVEGGEGFVRVVAREDNHLILGWQAVGPGVSELAAAFTYSIEMGARLEDVGAIIHAHPTLGEAAQEAALRALGRAIHV